MGKLKEAELPAGIEEKVEPDQGLKGEERWKSIRTGLRARDEAEDQ